MRIRLKSIIENTDTTAGRYFDMTVQGLIILSMVLLTLETVPELAHLFPYFQFFEYLILIFFSVEYLTRVYVADRKRDYIFSFYGIVDLLSILPFYLTLGLVDVRFARAFRLFRLLRLFKLTRYSKAMRRLLRAVA
ncbi:MAG: ion transporter, partial [Aggregatilineales bacterium]